MPARRLPSAIAVLLLASSCRKDATEPKQTEPAAVSPGTPAPILHLPPGAPGEWVDSKRYRLRVLDVRPCDENPTPSGPFRLGVTLEIEATAKDTSPVFTSPRGAVLEKHGQVFQAALDPSPTPACQAFLEPRRLAPGESTRGVLVFEAPHADYLRSAVLQFKPPRWGREYRADVALPNCFGSGCG